MKNNSITIESLSAYDSLFKEKNKNILQKDFKSIKKYIDYSDFSNWISFGSAQLEVNTVIKEIVEDYPDFELWSASASLSTLTLTANENFVAEYSGWVENSSAYSEYILKNELSLSSITATITGVDYGNSTSGTEYKTVIPYVERTMNSDSNNILLNDVQITAFESLLTSADTYDSINSNSVVNSIPAIVTEVNDELDSMLKIIGHGFDNFLLTLNDYKKIYNFSYKLNEMPSIKVLDNMIQNIGFKNIFNNLSFNILEKELAFYGNEYSKTDLEKIIKMFFINNIIYILKSKGTRESVKAFIKLLGWPEELFSIVEHIELKENISDLEYIYDEISFKKYPIHTVDSGIYDITVSSHLGSQMFYHFGLYDIAGIRAGTAEDYYIFHSEYAGTLSLKLRVTPSISGLTFYSFGGHEFYFPLTADDWSLVDDYEPLAFAFIYDSNLSSSAIISLNYVIPQMKLINSTDYASLSSYNYRNNILTESTLYWLSFSPNQPFSKVELIPTLAGMSSNIINYSLKFIDSSNIDYASASANLIKNMDALKWSTTGEFSDIFRFQSYNDEETYYEVLNSIPNRDSLTSSTTGNVVLKDIQLIKQHKVDLNAGIIPNFEGIFIDDTDNDVVENKIKAHDLLKINIEPAKVINEFIDNVLADYGISNLDGIYAKATDLYKSRWTELRTLKSRIQDFLLLYDGIININVFFEVIAAGYSNNILRFIKELLIPAKANLESGIIIESDKLYDKKYAWKKVGKDQIAINADIEHPPTKEGENVIKQTDVELSYNSPTGNVEISGYEYDVNIATDNLINDINTQVEYDIITDNLINNINTEFKVDTNLSDSSNVYNSSSGETIDKKYLRDNTEDITYINKYIDIKKWLVERSIFHGHEKQTSDIAYYYKYDSAFDSLSSGGFVRHETTSMRLGKLMPTNISNSWSLSSAINLEFAHKEYSELIINNDNDTLYGSTDENILEINLDRFGNSTPYGNVNILIPVGDIELNEPIINITNLTSEDIANSNNTNINIKLNEFGKRSLKYNINNNINLSATEEVTQANTQINFGSGFGASGTDEVIANIYANDIFKGEQGNLLNIIFQHDIDIAEYATSEVINNKTVIIKIIETPYTIWRLRDCLENTQIKNVLNITSLKTQLDAIIDSSLTADEYWRSHTFGDFILTNGSGNNKLNNKIYKIKINNIYNLKDSVEVPIIFKEKTNIIDENVSFEENQKNNN